MAAFRLGTVPITGIILIMEMTAPSSICWFVHCLNRGLYCRRAVPQQPIYEELLARSLQSANKNDGSHCERQRNVIELAVCSGSPIDGRLIKEINWPEHTLLVDVKRGESELIPIDTRLRAGDFLYVLTDDTLAKDLRKMAEGE